MVKIWHYSIVIREFQDVIVKIKKFKFDCLLLGLK